MNLQVGNNSSTTFAATREQTVLSSPFQSAESLSASSSLASALSSELPPEGEEAEGEAEQEYGPMEVEPVRMEREDEDEQEQEREEEAWRQCANCGSFLTVVTFEQGVSANNAGGAANDRQIPILHCTICEHSDGLDFEE